MVGTGTGGFTLRTAIASIIGGKFSNAAVFGAFVHMFNAEGYSESQGSFSRTFVKFKEGLNQIGNYFAKISGFRDWQEDSVFLGNYHQENAWQETKDTLSLISNIAEHPKLVSEAYEVYNTYNSEQLNIDFTVKGMTTIFATGIPLIMSSIGNVGGQAAELNRLVEEMKTK